MITTRRSASVGAYLSWPFRFICVLLWYIKEVIVANWAVIADNLTPGLNAHSGIARVPTRCESELEVTLLSSMITITPGTLTLGTTIDVHGVRWIYVHSLYDGDADAIREGSWDMEEHMLRAKRPEGFDYPDPNTRDRVRNSTKNSSIPKFRLESAPSPKTPRPSRTGGNQSWT